MFYNNEEIVLLSREICFMLYVVLKRIILVLFYIVVQEMRVQL